MQLLSAGDLLSWAVMFVLRTLGSVELYGRSGRLLRSVRQDKRLALLTYLACNDRVGNHRRDKLLALFWPDLDEGRARHSLRQSLYYLRQKLGAQAIVVRGEEVSAAHLWCDARALRQAVVEKRWESAVDLYRGEFLEGFHAAGLGPEFEQWLQHQRLELRDLAARAANSLIEAAAAAGDLPSAAAWGRKALAIKPLEETILHRLMTLLDDSGDRAGAVAVYDTFVANLREEYDLEPAPETLQLIAAIRKRSETGSKFNHGNGRAAQVQELAVPTPNPVLEGEEHPANPVAAQSPLLPDGSPEPHERQVAAPVAAAATEPKGTAKPAGATHWKLPTLRFAGTRAKAAAPPADAPPARAKPFQKLLLVAAIANTCLVALTWRTPEVVVPARATRLAVLPFQVQGTPGFDFLQDGLAELVSGSIAGKGIAGVPPAIVSQRAGSARNALASAEARARLARQLGADIVLAGEVQVEGERVRVSAAVFDARARGVPVRHVEVSGTAPELPSLAQRLASAVAPLPGGGRVGGTVTTSIRALQGYVAGQRLLKQQKYEAAMASFQTAVREDSSYALAYFGLTAAAEAAFHPAEAEAAAVRAAALASRLPERERDLLAARAAYLAGDASAAERFARAVLARYGDDVDAWFILGETHIRLNPLRGRSAGEARQAFETVLALQPERREARYHLAELASLRGDWTAVARLGRGFARDSATDIRAVQMRVLTRAAGAGGRIDSAALVAELGRASDAAAIRTARTVAVELRDLPASIRTLTLVESRTASPSVRAYAAILLAQLELARGHWRAAESDLGRARKIDPLRAAAYEALLVTAPGLPHDRSRLRAARRHLAEAFTAPQPMNARAADWSSPEEDIADLLFPYLDGRLGALLGDPIASARVAELNQASHNRTLAEHYALIVRAALDPAADPLPSGIAGVSAEDALLSPFFSLPEARYTHADRLARSGELDLADLWLGTLEELSIPDLVFGAPAHLRQAELARSLGRQREAAAHYRAFLALWKDADAELQPLVRYADRSLARLEPR